MLERKTEEKRFLELCQKYIDKYIGGEEISGLVERAGELNVKCHGPFFGRFEGCQYKSAYYSTRVKYESALTF